MADGSKIEWTDATPMIDREGRRIRHYQRSDTSRPGQQIRRQKLADGLKWCRGCQLWLPMSSVGKNGLCRTHENADAQRRYRDDERFRDARKGHSYLRKRKVELMPKEAANLISELFDGECAYCDSPYETWDHAVPVSKGGQTTPGNMVPACGRCNSSKKDADLDAWLDRAPVVKPYTLEYLSHSGAL